MKYVSVCCRSAGGDACMTPEMPPIVNSATSAIANFIATVKRMLPPHIVKIQLKIFTPVGIAMSIVVDARTPCRRSGPCRRRTCGAPTRRSRGRR